jgi:hypothetical protein
MAEGIWEFDAVEPETGIRYTGKMIVNQQCECGGFITRMPWEEMDYMCKECRDSVR